jgi:hypothetical protein
MVVAGGLRASDEEGHAVRGCVDRACRAVIVKKREFVISFSLECVCVQVWHSGNNVGSRTQWILVQ